MSEHKKSDKICTVLVLALNTSGLNCLLDCIVIVCVLSIEICDHAWNPSAHKAPRDLTSHKRSGLAQWLTVNFYNGPMGP